MNWEFKYCKCYCIVLHIMLFLIDFFKKRMWTFFSFFLISFHTMCVPSLHQIWPPAPSLHWIKMNIWKKKKKREYTDNSISLSFLAGLFFLDGKSLMAIQMSCFFDMQYTHPIHEHAGCNWFVLLLLCLHLVLQFWWFLFTFSYQLIIFSFTGAKFLLV